MEQHFFKLVIIGNSGVGKSSLLIRFCDDSFRDMYLTTIGVDFKFKTIDVYGTGIKLQIWDTAGQERFRTITSSYYKGAQGIVIVYDITSMKSFEDINRYWLQEVRNFADKGVLLMLIGNKCDLEETREVPKDIAERFAQENNMKHFEVSSKTAEHVDVAFKEFSADILKQSLETGNRTLIKEKRETPQALQQQGQPKEQSQQTCCQFN